MDTWFGRVRLLMFVMTRRNYALVCGLDHEINGRKIELNVRGNNRVIRRRLAKDVVLQTKQSAWMNDGAVNVSLNNVSTTCV